MGPLHRAKPLIGVVFATCVLFADMEAQPAVTVIMSGLDNPRGLAFGPEGALYVAEAGRGGDGPCVNAPAGLRCYGPTGAITRLWRGVQEQSKGLADPARLFHIASSRPEYRAGRLPNEVPLALLRDRRGSTGRCSNAPGYSMKKRPRVARRRLI